MQKKSYSVDEKLLKEVTKTFGFLNKSQTINIALEELLNAKKRKDFFLWAGSKIWVGNLQEIRKDRFPPIKFKLKI